MLCCGIMLKDKQFLANYFLEFEFCFSLKPDYFKQLLLKPYIRSEKGS